MEFLEYINTIDQEELNNLPGLTPALAEKVAAGRPFATLEDFSNVKGLTEKRLATLMEDFGKKNCKMLKQLHQKRSPKRSAMKWRK
jgi:hypothetical protein